MDAFSTALLDLAREDGNTSRLETMRNMALTKIAGGDSRSLISSSVNGKSFSYQINKPADELFTASSSAIKAYWGDRHTSSGLDFSSI